MNNDFEVIYLQPRCCEDGDVGRLWAEDDCFDCEDDAKPTKYIRADRHEPLVAAISELGPWLSAALDDENCAPEFVAACKQTLDAMYWAQSKPSPSPGRSIFKKPEPGAIQLESQSGRLPVSDDEEYDEAYDEAYDEWFQTMIQRCSCCGECYRSVPCDSVLAGGMCEQSCRCDEYGMHDDVFGEGEEEDEMYPL